MAATRVMDITKEQKCPEAGAVELSSAGEVFAVYKCEDHSSDLQNPGQSHVGRAVSINPSTQEGMGKAALC